MTGLWVGLGLLGWAVAAAAAGTVLGRGIEGAAAEENAELLADVELPDGLVDLLADQPVEILGPLDVDVRFDEIVAGLERGAR